MREGKENGSLRPDLDVNLVAIAILTVMNAMYLWYDPQRKEGPEHIVEQLAAFFEHGYVADPF